MKLAKVTTKLLRHSSPQISGDKRCFFNLTQEKVDNDSHFKKIVALEIGALNTIRFVQFSELFMFRK